MMLTKCMSTPQMLARSLSWAGRSGKPSAIMAIDIRDEHIGLALAYHRHTKPTTDNNSFEAESNIIPTTSINPLPPLPYMSRDEHHPSYSFSSRHRPVRTVAGMPSKPPRVERTLEVALQLAQLATQRSVKSVLVRWPGGGAALGMGGRVRIDNQERGELGGLLSGFSDWKNTGHKVSFYETLGYQRGRIMYVLDKCCMVHGHASSTSALLTESSRPFALWDTSDDQELITLSSRLDPSQSCAVPHSSKNNERCDKYGNSIGEMDEWGRAPIFGMPPDYTWRQKRAKEVVPSATGVGLGAADANFDQFHDAEAKVNQLKGSFAAMLTLRDFTNAHMEGRVVLPSWVKLHEDDVTNAASAMEGPQTHDEVHVGYRKDETLQPQKQVNATTQNLIEKTPAPPKQGNIGRLSTLVQMPRKRRRRSSETSVQLNGLENRNAEVVRENA